MLLFYVTFSVALTAQSAFAQNALTPDPKLMKKVGTCQSSKVKSSDPVYIIKQWHLSPGVNTRTGNKIAPPQALNLAEIEKQLGQWIDAKKLKSVIAEGCEGQLEDAPPFNGWSFADLKSKVGKAEFEKAVTHPVLKLEARYGDKVETYCGDLKAAIQEELAAFSDARADIGYAARLEQFRDDPKKSKIYLEGAIEAYKFPPRTDTTEAIKLLKADLKKNVTRIHELNLKRSLSLASTAIIVHAEPIAIVVGGMHAKEITNYLESKQRDCVILEPLHYGQDDDKLMEELDRATK